MAVSSSPGKKDTSGTSQGGKGARELVNLKLIQVVGRLYTQLDVSATGSIAQSRQAAGFAESGGQVDVHSITPDEVLAQANRIFAPYTLKFAAPLSWFAVWKSTSRRHQNDGYEKNKKETKRSS